jgi:hypothetical protein
MHRVLELFAVLKAGIFFSKSQRSDPNVRTMDPLIAFQRLHSPRYRKPRRTDSGTPNDF